MLELVTRVEIEEPDREAAIEILKHVSLDLEQEYGVTIPESACERAVTLSSSYILNECLPQKAIKILRNVCEDLDYERSQLGGTRSAVETDEIVRAVAEATGIPVETIAGQTSDADFEAALSANIVGQEQAVHTMANELRLIKAGLADPGKPASVMLFAGLTGVGKTELAKRLAEIYSASKRLQTYAMGNFTEPHSVSGIIGVPPGYVGHDQGGRLINELNADPYSVFLLDEAEKAHPNVWKPFLNLFDEGWITDQRGVKAYADRAIFILTTNAGDQAISQMTASNKPMEEVIEHVKNMLSRIRHERSSQPVFTPQFLSRMKRIVVFNPLDETAMIGIARKMVAQVQNLWRQKREKEMAVPDSLVEWIGQESHRRNQKSGGKEGGRIVRKLISDLIEIRVQDEACKSQDTYKQCRTIELHAEEQKPADEADVAQATMRPPEIRVLFKD